MRVFARWFQLQQQTCGRSRQHAYWSYFIQSFFLVRILSAATLPTAMPVGRTSENSRCSAMRMRRWKWNTLWMHCTPMQSSVDRLPCRRLTQRYICYGSHDDDDTARLPQLIASLSDTLHALHWSSKSRREYRGHLAWCAYCRIYAEQRLHRKMKNQSGRQRRASFLHSFSVRFTFE